MKKVLVGAMALLSLAACSNEEVLQKNEVKQEIGFTAVTGKATSRAADGYCNNHMPPSIWVSASYTNGSTTSQYFINDKYNGSGSNYTADGSVRYWPDLSDAGTKMKFYAAVNATPQWKTGAGDAIDYTGMIVKDFVVGTDVSQHKDFIFATKTVESKPTAGTLIINFRHALSQIVFKAKNENKNIYVEVTGVSVCEATNKGTYTFPEGDTDGNIIDPGHTNPFDPSLGSSVFGTWALASDSYEDAYAVTFTAVGLNANQAEAQSLTYKNGTATDATAEYNVNTMYLLPQKFTSTKVWNPDATPYVKPGTTAGQAYFLVKAKIWNIATPSDTDPNKGGCNTSTDVVVWGNPDAKDIAIPIPTDTEWKQGKKYVYTFTFTKTGEGGWEPGTDTPTPVLTPIKLSVSVDDFAEETDTKVDMAKPVVP